MFDDLDATEGAGLSNSELSGSAARGADDVSSWSTEALAQRVLALDAQRCAVEAELLATLGSFVARGGHEADGAGSAGAWAAHRLEVSGAAARAQVSTAQSLAWMPESARRMAAGELSPAKVALLAKAGRQVPDSVFAEAESFLIDQIRDLSVDHSARVLRFWVTQVQLADGAYDDGRQLRRLWLSRTFRGGFDLAGWLDPEAGQVVSGELERLSEELRGAEADGEPTTAWQRRADALVAMAERSMRADDAPDATPAVPLLTAIVDLTTAFGAQATGPDVSGELRSPRFGWATPGTATEAERLGFGRTLAGAFDADTPLSAETARRLSCDAAIARILLAGSDQPVNLGRATYTPSRAQRRALVARDAGCVFPGCDQRPSRCHAHHIQHWSDGGATDLRNLCLVCNRHHHLIHEGGWSLRRRSNGGIEVRRPDGTLLSDPRRRPPPGWQQAVA